MDLLIDDYDARIFRYYEDFNRIVEDNGLQGLIGADNEDDAGYKSRMKSRCRLLTENLQPPVLKPQIMRVIDLKRRDCKSDEVVLFDLILEHAKMQQRFHRMSQDYAAKQDPRIIKGDRKPQQTGTTKTATTPAAAPVSPPASTSFGTKRAPWSPRSPPVDGCLLCKGRHWLKDCPIATYSQQRKDARRKFSEAKEQRSGALRSKAARYATAAGSVRINGLLEMAYSPGTGADQSIVPRDVVD
ncbi:hypothetical protein PF005_g3872 [Phytophthora fragariae]|uniref:Uncharacterized protein n=2 Tax=Phytophthora fragariae TaxID=53985 RepID=A0A6A3T948_9STRA|nr:hypothetical protein PF003_g22019 [Phytophthora fragariae]KAE9131081.1 hypothetical protein PF010_g3614 [Phytophthora fragariae]KAE9132212.1 hypothetical protein PF007_g3817 [Phytophthora fragariae]KAE9152560.1 hypothetical protein PF006_g3230 [Phytophthora fragariae]KAE9229445.1 hypothetical protein PF005_g3872 [Phytophthora fragariae]